MGGKSKKIVSSLNLEVWLWEWVDYFSSNRSKFFTGLVLEDMKRELVHQKLMTEADEISEVLGEVYVNINLYRNRMKNSLEGRKPIRCKKRKNNNEPKKPISIRMDKWLWELCSQIEPNRSLFIKTKLLQKIKMELIWSGILPEKSEEEDLSEQYIKKAAFTMMNRKVS